LAPPGSLSRTAARGTGVTLAAQAVRTLLQFGSVVVLARLLTPADFGLVAMVTAVIGVADLIRDLACPRRRSRAAAHTRADEPFWANLALAGSTVSPRRHAADRRRLPATAARPHVMTLAWCS
jgi:PST family polysaccharide transporter